ncbi:MAG TPA: cadherin-like domain-containing protein, partial [Aggregatilineales bacterium]|nr:cadherin-like domain-containing protein [Aggregatilineales bacterium]
SIKLSPPIGAGKTLLATLSTGNGVSVSTQATRNYPPVLAASNGVSLAGNSTVTIDAARLTVTDIDEPPDKLVFTITAPPTQGTLSLSPTFTQADINGGLLTYTQTGTGNDSFSFTVTDGDSTIGPYTFTVNP